MKKLIIVLLSSLFTSQAIHAHTINYVLQKPQNNSVISDYIVLGYKHILPLGLDHILFIVCVFFLSTNLRTIVKQATLFTIAHSITLALVACNIIIVPSQIVEPIIALSIAVLAIENIFFANNTKPYRYIMIFGFGLVHGMGFAGALAELQLPQASFAQALVSFNIGVELGQLSIIAVLYGLLKLIFEHKTWYRTRILVPANIAIGIVAICWVIQRINY